MEQLIQELKEKIIKELKLEATAPEDIYTDAPLFGEGLGLDSIDALEIILIMERDYGIRFNDSKEAKTVLYSIQTIAEYVTEHRKK